MFPPAMSTHPVSSRTVDPPRVRSHFRANIAVVAAGIGLLAAACGGAGSAPDNPAAAAAGDAAQQNADSLEINTDVRLTEVLDVSDGSVQTLRTAVAGDRPVLLWFWAPH